MKTQLGVQGGERNPLIKIDQPTSSCQCGTAEGMRAIGLTINQKDVLPKIATSYAPIQVQTTPQLLTVRFEQPIADQTFFLFYVHWMNAKLTMYVPCKSETNSAVSNAPDVRLTGVESGFQLCGADIIAVDGDPLKDVRVLEHVSFVMKSGVVYKDAATRQEAAGH